jgi:hypothetical protein
MIILGVILALLGYWLLPEFVPSFPGNLDHLMGVIGVILIIVGIVLWILGAAGRPVGGRRTWY